MSAVHALLTGHLVVTVAMAGLIWFVQVVHYPLFQRVGIESFSAYAVCHQRRTTWVVAPLMIIEGLAALILVLLPAPGAPRAFATVGLLLVAVNWISTAWLQVPCHRRLAAGYDTATARRLVATNWLRTIAWTARVPVAVALMAVSGP